MSSYRFDRLRVLLVDDNAHMRKLIVTVLHAFGVVLIHEADDATRAWQILRDINPDVILLDWMMEGMTGIELAKQIRTSPNSPNPFVPIIMLSSHTLLDRVREARDNGINEFLAKPITVKGIMTRLISVIENPRPFVRTKSYFGPCRRRRESSEYEGPERRASEIRAEPVIDAVA